MRNIVDFHIHGIGSKYKDAFATASYDHICAYFERLAQKRKRDVIIAFTEHDCSVISFDQYKDLQKKYPHVKIMLGMEANAKLTHATDGVFEVAHVLAYADMSNDESVKKWLECGELKDLSKIKTFQIERQVPSNQHIIITFCELLNSEYGTQIDIDEVLRKFGTSKLRSTDIQQKVLNYVSQKIYENKDFAFASCKTVDEVENKLKTINFFVNKKPNILSGLVPSQYSFSKNTNVKLAIKKLEKLIGKEIDKEEFDKELNYSLHNADFDRQFAIAAAKIIQKDKLLLKKLEIRKYMKVSRGSALNPEYIQNYISTQILRNARFNSEIQNMSEFFVSEVSVENFGEKLYMAKSILNKNIGTKITNREIAELLDNVKSRQLMRHHFINLVKFSIKYNNPNLYKRIQNLSTEDLAKYPLGRNYHGSITLNILVPSSPNTNHNITTDIRTPLEEINSIVKKTGGHLILAHPDLVFKFSDGKSIPTKVFQSSDKDLLSNSKIKEIRKDLRATGEVSTTKLLGNKEKLLKLELFFRLCRQKGINFDGFEIRKANLRERDNFRNYMIYAAKNDYDISFGSDAHFSNIHFYYDLLLDGRIKKEEFDKLAEYADKIGDNTAKEGIYKVYYPTKFVTKKNNINFARIKPCKGFVKNNYGKIHNNNYIVEQTNFCDKLLGKDKLEDAPLLTLKYNQKIYSFDKKLLSQLKYNFGDDGETFGGKGQPVGGDSEKSVSSESSKEDLSKQTEIATNVEELTK